MAWDNFWALDPAGRRVSSPQQLATLRRNFPERIVEPKPAIKRPLMIVLDKPYKLARLMDGEGYEQTPVLLRDLHGWPPKLSLSRFGHLPRPGEGDVVDAKVIPAAKPGLSPLLIIRGDFDNQEAASTIIDYPQLLLECVAKTLNEHQGEPIKSLIDLELSGVD